MGVESRCTMVRPPLAGFAAAVPCAAIGTDTADHHGCEPSPVSQTDTAEDASCWLPWPRPEPSVTATVSGAGAQERSLPTATTATERTVVPPAGMAMPLSVTAAIDELLHAPLVPRSATTWPPTTSLPLQ